MDIMFEIVSRQKFSPDVRISYLFGETGGTIGRSGECDWILPDRTNSLSRKHAVITFYNGTFHIEDTSTNGIFTTLGRDRLPSGVPVEIRHGDGFIIGEYTIMARLMQRADSYVGTSEPDINDFLAEKTLPLNPLDAMDAEAERDAAARLGGFNDILGRKNPESLVPHDHSLATLSVMPSYTATFEEPPLPYSQEQSATISMDAASAEQSPLSYDPWDPQRSLYAAQESFAPEQNALMPNQEQAPLQQKEIVREVVAVAETDAFFKTLGFAAPPESPEERERVLTLCARLLKESIEGLSQAMQNRAECKKELRLSWTTTVISIANNPLKFSPTADAALATMLALPQKGVMEPIESVRSAFRDNHSHHMGLLAGARAAVGATLDKISPQTVETRLDIDGQVQFRRSGRLWKKFIQMHRSLADEPITIQQDFARAYEMQVRTLNPAAYRHQRGDR